MVAAALGVSAAVGVAACGEDREGDVQFEDGTGTTGPGTTGTVGTSPTGTIGTEPPEDETGDDETGDDTETTP